MKFATIALAATASAIQIKKSGACTENTDLEGVFKMIDTNDNGSLNYDELIDALRHFAHA